MTEIELRFYHLACSFFANNTKQETKEIDWEQRRYEIAKSALIGCVVTDKTPSPKAMAKSAVDLADALIEELKKVTLN